MLRRNRSSRRSPARRARLDREPPGILLVDDDPEILDLLGEVLSRRGYRVLGARDGLDAMEDRSRNIAGFGVLDSIDLVITDLVMPHASGIDLLQYMRSNDWPAAAIVLSAFVDHDLRGQALEFGADAVLPKPFVLEELLHIVERLVPSRPAG